MGFTRTRAPSQAAQKFAARGLYDTPARALGATRRTQSLSGFLICSALSAINLTHTLAAEAQQDQGSAPTEPSEATRNYVNLRAGGTSVSAESGRPDICAETTPLRLFSLEACGSGSGLWHQGGGKEMMHLRAKWNITSLVFSGVGLEPALGVGMAELQLTSDAPGLRFSDAGEDGIETAGPEASVSLRALYPLAHGLELVGSTDAGVAYLPQAGSLALPQSEWQPFVSISVGVGF